MSGTHARTPINLGTAANYVIVAGSTVTSTGVVGTVVTGNLALYPGTAVTGFPPAILNGSMQIANGAGLAAITDLTTAYNYAAGLAFNTTLSNLDLGGMTLLPGVYKFDATAALNGDLTLDAGGDETASWVFQIGSELNLNENSAIRFKDDFGNADCIYWQVGTSAILGKKANIMGNIMADQSISLNSKAIMTGRLLARIAAVTLDDNVVTMTNAVVPINNGNTFGTASGDDDSKDEKLSGGAIAGIVIGAVLIGSLMAGSVAYFVFGIGAKGVTKSTAVPAQEV